MKPLLAHIYESSRWDTRRGCFVQPKYDGVRALYQGGKFQSRDNVIWRDGVLDHIGNVLKNTFSPDTVLDGELYIHGWKLQEINSAISVVSLEPSDLTRKVQYYIFDRAQKDVEFGKRFATVQAMANDLQGSPVRIAHTEWVTSHAEADAFYMKCVTDGYEGIMYRINDCPYTVPKQLYSDSPLHGNTTSSYLSDKQNRTFHLLKRKDWQDAEFECIGMLEGEGKRTGMVGNFICRTSNGREFNVGTGLNDEDWARYFTSPPLGRMLTIKYRCLTSNGTPFNPIIKIVH